jgi:hypothetical protein
VTEYGGRLLDSRDLDMMYCLKSHWGAAGKALYRDLKSHVKVGTANPSEGAQPASGAFVLDGKPNHPGEAHDLAAILRTHWCMSLSDVVAIFWALYLSGMRMHLSVHAQQALRACRLRDRMTVVFAQSWPVYAE